MYNFVVPLHFVPFLAIMCPISLSRTKCHDMAVIMQCQLVYIKHAVWFSFAYWGIRSLSVTQLWKVVAIIGILTAVFKYC
jgi:hypothetical protein